MDSQNPTEIFFGNVISESPLKILLEQKLLLGEKQLILSRNVTDFQTEISFDDPEILQETEIKELKILGDILDKNSPKDTDIKQHIAEITAKFSHKDKVKHKITLYNALKAGELVAVIRLRGGEKYLVLDRVVG